MALSCPLGFAMTSKDHGVFGSPNQNVTHPAGLACYGMIPEIVSKGEWIPAGEIFLRVGRHTGPNRGFGVRHIWAEHEKELTKMGYHTINDVARYISDIIRPGAKIYCEFNSAAGRHRPTVLKSPLGLVVQAPETASGHIYTVVTAYTKRTAHDVLVGNVQ